MPRQTAEGEGVQQADLLKLPNDNGYKYCLTVVDIATNASDAEPLKTKGTTEVIQAFKTIYSRNYLSMPYKLEVDKGSEFKGETRKYFENNGVIVRVGQTGRHRQQSHAERFNMYISKAVFNYQLAVEMNIGETNRQWVSNLSTIIRILNKKLKKNLPKPSKTTPKPVCKGDSCVLLDEGDKVRVKLEEPRDNITNKRLHGKFRTGDLRFEKKSRKIDGVLVQPQQPPLYTVEGKKQVAYTKNQLQQVNPHEQKPVVEKIEQYKGVKIIGKKKYNGRIMYRVQRKGSTRKDAKYESRTELVSVLGEEAVKQLEQQYNKSRL